MKLKLLLLFLLLSICVYPQSYKSTYCEEYVYNSSNEDYTLSNQCFDSVEIKIDTLYNTILIMQKIDSVFYLKREFRINNFDYNYEEDLYYFFVEETEITEEYSRKYIIYFSVPDSIITIVLEYEYSICYFL